MSNTLPSNNSPVSRRNFIIKSATTGIALGVAGIPRKASAEESSDKNEKIRALFVTGGGYHDYQSQKTILTEGVSKLIDVEWTIWHLDKADEMKAALSKAGWADPFDVVVYSICHAHEKDSDYINSVVNVHKAGKAMVAIHCTMHSYHWEIGNGKNSKEDKEWNKLLGVVSLNHGSVGPPIQVTQTEQKSNSYKPSNPEWKTPKGELYHIASIYPSATALANGNNGESEHPVIWVNKYEKANVFATSIGHHNETMEYPEFLKTVANGMVWAVNETAKA